MVLYLIFCGPVQAQARRKGAAGGPAARWAGQTGKDYVSKNTEIKPDQIQDVQIHLSGIPTARLTNITLKGNGSGEWQWVPNGKPPAGWAMHLVPDSRPGQAELYFQNDRMETGREFELKWTVQGQPEQTLFFQGGSADPTKPVASAAIAARWIGQEPDHPVDLTNRSAAVGPDGFEDAVIEIEKISEKDAVTAVDMETSDGQTKWSFGLNPQAVWSAELVRQPENAKTARLVFSVPVDTNARLKGKSLKIRLRYASNAVSETTLVADRADGDLAMPSVKLAKLVDSGITAQWGGALKKSKAGPGAVRISLAKVPPQSKIASIVLTDSIGTLYAALPDNAKPDVPDARPMVYDRTGPDKATLEFLPESSLSDSILSLRIHFTDGSNSLVTVKPEPLDLQQRVPALRPGRVNARQGEDLQGLVNRAGTVVLGDGEYRLTRPLLIDKPTRIEAAPNARPLLVFSPGETQDWTAAIKIRSGGVSLSGFAIKFSGPIPWSMDVAYGPAVIATTDNRDTGFNHDTPLWGVTLEKLTVQGPPVPRKNDPKQPPEAVKLARILNARLGRVEGCIFKGGTLHLAGGPWVIRQNRHDGPLAGSFAWDAFAIMRPQDVLVESNRIEPTAGSGKLWRFLNLTQHGVNIRVAGNLVRNVGPREGDTIADMNANEIFLTESYRIKFEGEPAQVSADGRVLRLPGTLAQPPHPGDQLAILSGPNAGNYHTVIQPLGNGQIAVEPPLDAKDRSLNPPAVSLATGFRGVVMDRNTIDATGSKTAFNIVLAGNHFGTVLSGNTITGGGESLRVTSFPTESPNIWGWSHAPMVGLKLVGNTVTGAAKPGRIAVDFNQTIKTSRGRCYFAADVKGNNFAPSAEGPALQFGDPAINEPASLKLTLTGNKSPESQAEIQVISATVNGKSLIDTKVPVTISAEKSQAASVRR